MLTNAEGMKEVKIDCGRKFKDFLLSSKLRGRTTFLIGL